MKTTQNSENVASTHPSSPRPNNIRLQDLPSNLALTNTDVIAPMIIRHEVDRQNPIARIIAERKTQRHAAAPLAAVRLERRQEPLRGLRVDGGARTLREGADVAVAVHLLAGSGGAAAGVAEGAVEDVVHGAVEAAGAAAAVDAEGAGGEVRGRVGGGEGGGFGGEEEEEGNEGCWGWEVHFFFRSLVWGMGLVVCGF